MNWEAEKEKFYDFIIENKVVGFYKEPVLLKSGRESPFYVNWRNISEDVYLTDKFAYNLKSFQEVLDGISIDSLYYHFIESRLYNQLHLDDISMWIEQSLGLAKLAQSIRNIDISVYTLNKIRAKIEQLIDEHLNKLNTKTNV